ncbi:M64 family metallopeptidase [Spirillospora sp. NPDC029432]|uniref:M64 family metallopeptidase n=1 Tax=Spirillospora sp. NPDC029432 TaxID=3154599 RepID=UPI0034549F33
MAPESLDLVLFPHCDMHVALSGTPALRVAVMDRLFDPDVPDRYSLEDVTAECTFEFFAPHNEVGHRLDGLPKIEPTTGLVTAATPGVYLFQARWETAYIVGRLQVHNQITAWWFGNDSITTALDAGTATRPGIAHAQPSIYAKFSDDATGADRIGDITGHRYVTLTPDEPAKLAITPQGRLRGLAETADPTHITGSFLGKTAKLPVRVFDYTRSRPDLYPIQTPDVPHADDMHNVLFLSEGFRDTDEDRKLFDEVVTKTVREMFDKPRHEPYPMLEGSFNVFKAFIPSQEHLLTCGFRVTDADLTQARPIPFNRNENSRPGVYTLQELVARVGLPMHNESRFDLVNIWKRQGLEFDESLITPGLLSEWRSHDAVGILHARDTVFGLYLGSRPADRLSGSSAPVPRPPTDSEPASDELKKFIARVYEFYGFQVTRRLSPDPRRHPPELFAETGASPGTSIMRYLGGLRYAYAPFSVIGKNWVPASNPTKPQLSLGLVAIVANDDLKGGTNLGGLLAVQTMDRKLTLPIAYSDLVDKREMRRNPQGAVQPDLTDLVDTVTHEFGHTFNLGDEYEFQDGDGDSAAQTADLVHDNLSVLGFLRAAPEPSRLIDPTKLKWLHLPLMSLSAKLLVESVNVEGGIKVAIDPRYIGKWVQAKKDGAEVRLRNFKLGKNRQLLPLSPDPSQFLVGLHIGAIDESLGTIVLIDATPPFPKFDRGSVLYAPLMIGGQAVEVVDEKVQQWLVANRSPMNRDPDHVHARVEDDKPIDIPGFFPPCDSTKTLGVFEGANAFAGGFYRPAGRCRMRNSDKQPAFWSGIFEDGGAFCDVCKWLIVHRVDPSYHAALSATMHLGTL